MDGISSHFKRGENGELHIGVRRHVGGGMLMVQPFGMAWSILSSDRMHPGAVAATSHAISTGTHFSVCYRPGTSPFGSIVSVNQFLQFHNSHVRTMFMKRVEVDEAPERSVSGQMCAIKEVRVIFDDQSSNECLRQLNQEITLVSQLSHPNIVQYYRSELNDSSLSVYLEYVSGGSIHKLLQEFGPFEEPVIQSYTGQILSGLAYLHGRKTVHRLHCLLLCCLSKEALTGWLLRL